jgi:hypothetical protein
MPKAGGATPAEWMTFTGQLVDAGTVAAALNGFSAVALRWRHEPDAAVAIPAPYPLRLRQWLSLMATTTPVRRSVTAPRHMPPNLKHPI